MNKKHLAVVVVGLLGFLFLQFLLSMQGSVSKRLREVEEKAAAEQAMRERLAGEQMQLQRLEEGARALLTLLKEWEPLFQKFGSPQSFEAEMAVRVRQAGLVSLAQRFEKSSVKNISSIPEAVRGFFAFDDEYSKLLNWMGNLEQDIPTLRVASVRLTRGTRPSDIRMELLVEQPLLK